MIYCSEKVLSQGNSASNFKIEENFCGQSFELDQSFKISLNEIFKKSQVSNKSVRFSNYPKLPLFISDHMMLIDLPLMKKRETFNSKIEGKSKYEIDLNEIQNLLLYFSYCDIIIYLVNKVDTVEEIDYLDKLTQNSLILQTLKNDNKFYVLIDNSNPSLGITSNSDLQLKLEKIIIGISHKFYYEANLATAADDKTLFFYRYFKENTSELKANELERLEEAFLSIAEKKYLNQGKTIKDKKDVEYKQFKTKLEIDYLDAKTCIHKDFREFEEVFIDAVYHTLSKNLNVIKSELSYKMLIAVNKSKPNSTEYLDKLQSLKQEILTNIHEVFNSILEHYEENKQLFINEYLTLSSLLNDVKLENFEDVSLMRELFDFTGRNHKYSYLNENTRIHYNEYILSLFARFTNFTNVMQNKFAFLERKIISIYNNGFLALEKDFICTNEKDYSIILNQIQNTPIDKILPIKLNCSGLCANVFFSIFSEKSPSISSVFPYYLIPNFLGIIFGTFCFKSAFYSKVTQSVLKVFLGLSCLAMGGFFSILTNKYYNQDSKESFHKNISAVDSLVDNISFNIMNLASKLKAFEKFYEEQATELIDLF